MNNTIIRRAQVNGKTLELLESPERYRVRLMSVQTAPDHRIFKIGVQKNARDLDTAEATFETVLERQRVAEEARLQAAAAPVRKTPAQVASNDRIRQLRELFQARRVS